MSLRLEMLQVARMAPSLLRDSCELVRDFVLSQLSDSGGFLDRGGDVEYHAGTWRLGPGTHGLDLRGHGAAEDQ